MYPLPPPPATIHSSRAPPHLPILPNPVLYPSLGLPFFLVFVFNSSTLFFMCRVSFCHSRGLFILLLLVFNSFTSLPHVSYVSLTLSWPPSLPPPPSLASSRVVYLFSPLAFSFQPPVIPSSRLKFRHSLIYRISFWPSRSLLLVFNSFTRFLSVVYLFGTRIFLQTFCSSSFSS